MDTILSSMAERLSPIDTQFPPDRIIQAGTWQFPFLNKKAVRIEIRTAPASYGDTKRYFMPFGPSNGPPPTESGRAKFAQMLLTRAPFSAYRPGCQFRLKI